MDYLLNLKNKLIFIKQIFLPVLNLIINGLPSKLSKKAVSQAQIDMFKVLNLIINGLPSKRIT